MSALESKIQRDILEALGCEPDLIVMRNLVARLKCTDEDGKQFRMWVGLGQGTPDIVGILRVSRSTFEGRDEALLGSLPSVGGWFALEVKRPGEKAEEHQRKAHGAWRKLGAFVAVVTSVDEARAALARARDGETS